jgi:hypothetical protein
MVTGVEAFNTPGFFTHFVRKNTTSSAQFEHGGGSPLVQVTHDAGGTLSNEDNFLREASLCREIFTVGWRYWITLVVWFGCYVWVERRLDLFLAVMVTKEEDICIPNVITHFVARHHQQCPVRTLRWFPTRVGNSRCWWDPEQ